MRIKYIYHIVDIRFKYYALIIIKYTTMLNKEIYDYTQSQYDKWLEITRRICQYYHAKDEAEDFLNEILVSVLQKDENKIIKLLHKKNEVYTDLDYYIIKMIKLNICSPKAPFQQKYGKNIPPINTSIPLHSLQVYDQDENDIDRINLIWNIFNKLDISDFDRDIFRFCYVENKKFTAWAGPESLCKLYGHLHKIESLIKDNIKKIEKDHL